ncbi:hypothetical protein B0A79_01465 [Flavobacterium piscis]|jgi:hypothetical protein|uniref:Lipoprotein n=1 Tax=Flavobacterium piscis TaxID=1114874 RepID=A0ABX2XDY0_9FLAO|nr:hypothetical protein [Flavobacterium piscis]OCB70111.1 hypothetical protein FLP_20850 [Flavobacterium piscis]OXG07894.1 hypothetical protein B0A79_01465 [Flavobacterium piscis]
MKNNTILLFAFLLLCLVSCKEENKFPLEKKYWDVTDYDNVIREVKYGTKPDEKLPTFDNPETKLLLEKLTDQENFKVVLDDKELGLKHRNEIAQQFFDKWKDMTTIYNAIDRTDKYIYEKEYLEVFNFGLGLQLRYFKLGNDEIIEKADDPNSLSVLNTINRNTQTLVNNMIIYLDEINNEKSYSDLGLNLIANGIDKNFTELINIYPNFNYDDLLEKVNLMLKKTKSENIKQSLTKLKQLIESKKSTKVEHSEL